MIKKETKTVEKTNKQNNTDKQKPSTFGKRMSEPIYVTFLSDKKPLSKKK
jgi:hypothetical protein